MPEKLTQKDWPVAASSPLGEDVLLFKRMKTIERLGRPFTYELVVESEDAKIDLTSLVGKTMSVRLDQQDGKRRHFHGYVSRFVQSAQVGDFTEYRATLVPWLWFLTRRADCRIFQELNAKQIISQVMKTMSVSDYDDKGVSGPHVDREFCVQYRETDFNFVSRLMEDEGIYYYFEHTASAHTLKAVNASSAHKEYKGYEKMSYRTGDAAGALSEWVSAWSLHREVQSGEYSLSDYDFTAPRKDLFAKKIIKRKYPQSDGAIFDYPGTYLETKHGEELARIRLEELQASDEVVVGDSNARAIIPGHVFTLEDHPRPDQARKYLVTSATMEINAEAYAPSARVSGAKGGLGVTTRFTAIDMRQPYRPPRVAPKPVVQGPQTAVVVGKKGEEFWTDKYGRVKVRFHWDHHDKTTDGKTIEDENRSCFIRVSQSLAGKGWGAMQMPRIGQEVIVDFLEGDPDRPIITGRVYNELQLPPYKLPDHSTKMTLMSRSSAKGAADNFNEIRFEDKKGKEELYIHAERDSLRVVENSEVIKVGFDTKDPGEQKLEIYGDRSRLVEKGDDTITIKSGSRTVDVKKDILIEAGNQITIKTGQSQVVMKKSGEISITGVKITVAGKSDVKIKGLNVDVKANVKAGVSGTMLDLKGSAMTNVKGGLVKIN